MYHILVVDDEPMIRSLIRKYAEFENYKVTEAQDGMEAVDICRAVDFDLIVMDVMMPELDGFSAAREILKLKDIPIIILSARGEEYDRIHGFEVGVDDYVVKPFSPRELMMRINAVLSRLNKAIKKGVREYGGLVIDYAARVVMIDGEKVELSPKEYDLLVYLSKNADIALTRDKILNNVWGYDFYGDDRTLDTHIKLLRSRLGQYRNHIVTLRGVGYRFEK